MKAVFLSYASQDAEVAQRICDALRAAGLEVWFDQSELRGGDAWDALIRRQVRECALFVPVISANTQARSEGYFRREWNMAAQRTLDMADDQAFLLPVVIDATSDANARVPDKFREVQWTRLPAGATSTVFAEHVKRLLTGAAAPAVSAPPHAGPAAARGVTTPAPDPQSIAVLPFVNRSHNEEDEYFSDGLADEMLNVLAKIRGLRVAARTSSFQFKGRNDDIAVIGRKLNVATVLEGSVRKSGNRLRISVQLVKVADGYHLWSQTYERTLEDIFAVQDDIAQSVVKELRGTLLGAAVGAEAAAEATAQVAAAVKGRATDPEAHRLYLQGRYLVDRLNRDDMAKGIGYLKEALERDPAFALAWAKLGFAHLLESYFSWTSIEEGYRRGREAVERALSLEPDLAEGHAQLGFLRHSFDWDWRGAEASLRRALELAPGNAVALHHFARLALSLARPDEAIRLMRQAIEQDPLSAAAYNELGVAFDAAERYPEAGAAYRKALELAPQSTGTRLWLVKTLLAQSRNEEALDEALRVPGEGARTIALAIVHHAAGHAAEADAALCDLKGKFATDSAYDVADVYAARGETDLAFEWLERAYAERDLALAMMQADPLLRPLHADPRWAVFLRKMGLAD